MVDKTKKKNKKYRKWRPRKDYYGQMQQFDGSYHNWFKGRLLDEYGEVIKENCLLASIDDATGQVTELEFAPSEGVIPVFSFWKGYFREKGKPFSIYLDKGSTYKVNFQHLLDDPWSLTQFEQAMNELKIEVIHAHSPQAKGRVERLFKTLQDRLVKEMRLADISSIKETNKFLKEFFIPHFNTKFSVVAKRKGDVHKTLNQDEKQNLDAILANKEERTIANDFTIRYKNKYLQLDQSQPTLVRRSEKVTVEKRTNNSIHINLKGKYLAFTELPERPKKLSQLIGSSMKNQVTALTKTKQSEWKPPINHPWRKSSSLFFQNNRHNQHNRQGKRQTRVEYAVAK